MRSGRTPDPLDGTRDAPQRLGRELGLDADVTRVPKLFLRAAGLFSPFMREVLEMTYQWEAPFVIDDARFRETFGYGPTPVEEQVQSTAAWARSRFGHAVAA